MIIRGRIAAAILTVGIAGTLYADMTPMSVLDMASQPVVGACSQTNSQDAGVSGLCDIPSVGNPGFGPIPCLPDTQVDCGLAATPEATVVLANDQGSLSLCLYALLGVGLCRSAPWVKKLSFTCIPEWYHDGGPFQIGHSTAISPDCLCHASVRCLVQPDCTADRDKPPYDFATIFAVWRDSQFTPAVLASRGPPFRSC